MKKLLIRAVIVLLICLLLSTTAYADMGPKFSVRVTVEGLDGRTCYATLLSKQVGTGPYSAWDGSAELPEYLSQSGQEGAAEAFRAFADYQDSEGLYFLCQVFPVENGSFSWGYYPPDTFRVALYFPDTKQLVVGELLDRYAFSSAYRTTLQPDGTLSAFEKTNPPSRQIPSFLLRVAATILIELLIAGFFGYWDRLCVPTIVWTNLVTQLGLNLILALISHSSGSYGFFFYVSYLLLELGVFIVEAIVYSVRLPARCLAHPGRLRPVLYALLANAASFGLGIQLSILIPFAF